LKKKEDKKGKKMFLPNELNSWISELKSTAYSNYNTDCNKEELRKEQQS